MRPRHFVMLLVLAVSLCSHALGITINSTNVNEQQLTINGGGFNRGTFVYVNGSPVTILSGGATQIIAALPKLNPGVYSLTVGSGQQSVFFAVVVPAFPVVVAETSFLNVALPLLPQTIFTPSADGNFRMTVYMDVPSTAVFDSAAQGIVGWTDDYEANQLDPYFTASAFNNYTGMVIAIRAKANIPITWSSDLGCCNIAFAYPMNAYITLERLSY